MMGGSPGERLILDTNQLQVRCQGGEWQLVTTDRVLGSFGSREQEARQARDALRYYRCTEQVVIGKPQPAFSFFLVNGQAPQGTVPNLRSVPFRPDLLQVNRFGSSYVLWDGSQVVLAFGDRLNEAQEALQAIRHYRFDRLYRLGQDQRGLVLPVRTR